jgi:hypothetical protein
MRFWAPVLALALVCAAAVPAAAAPVAQAPFARGAVVALRGTPHLWIADDAGVLHWGGDTRALTDKFVDWGARAEFSYEQIRGFTRGDPWLSTGLLKSGDPIYLAKWESGEATPTLLHIRSIADVELFGINGSNYGALVLDQPVWEQRYGMASGPLARGVLAPAGSAVPGASRENPVPLGQAADLSDGWRLQVAAVTPNANSVVLSYNSFNRAPAGGSQFFLVHVIITRVSPTAAPFLGDIRLRAVGGQGNTYSDFEQSCGRVPGVISPPEGFSGDRAAGNVCWRVSAADVDSLVLYDNVSYSPIDPSQRVFFALK